MLSFANAEQSNIWSHSEHVADLYRRRARNEDPEMDCAAQAAELLVSISSPGDSVLDAGAGAGWFLHSIRKRNLDLEYWAFDSTSAFVEIAHEELVRFGQPAQQIQLGMIEHVEGSFDHVVCMNVLSNIPNWHVPLDRLAARARKSLIIRESLGSTSHYSLVRDDYLDEGVDLNVHVNRYSVDEVSAFLRDRGFSVQAVPDERTRGVPELVIDYPHYWTFILARKENIR